MIVTSPTHRWLKEALGKCDGSIAICSPYVGAYLNEMVGVVDNDFASRASDLEAVRGIAKRTGGVLSLSSLHAKVYVIGLDRALVTSANGTFSGMYRNRECGVEITKQDQVSKLRKLIHTGFGTRPKPKLWTAEDLEQLVPSVEALRAALPKVVRREPAAPEMTPIIRLRRAELSRVVETFTGWLRLTLEGISRLGLEEFSMEQVYQICSPLAAASFPANHHVRELHK